MCNVLQLGEVVYRPTCVRSLACNAFLSILSHRSNRNNDARVIRLRFWYFHLDMCTSYSNHLDPIIIENTSHRNFFKEKLLQSYMTLYMYLSTEKVSPIVFFHCKEMPCMLLMPLLIVKINKQSYYSHLISKRIMSMKKLINPLFKSEIFVSYCKRFARNLKYICTYTCISKSLQIIHKPPILYIEQSNYCHM